MAELRLRDDRGRFSSSEDESNFMNSMLKNLAGGAPPQDNGAGEPVPPGASPALPVEDENAVMNKRMRELCGIYEGSR